MGLAAVWAKTKHAKKEAALFQRKESRRESKRRNAAAR
jgi:hypothetical protein